MQNPGHAPGRSGISRGPSDGSVGGNFTARNFADGFEDAAVHRHIRMETATRDKTLARTPAPHGALRRRAFAKRLEGIFLALVDVENRHQLGHLQKISDALRQIGQLD